MAEHAPLSLSVGDRVVYPNQGVCRVASVEAKEVAGQRLTFVTMRREEDGAVVMVPQAKIQTIGLRKVATADEVTALFAFLHSDSDKADLDWKQRARSNLERMSQGGIQGLAEVVKGLQVLSELRPLPTKERELYDNARHLLVSEIAASLTLPECDAEDTIDVALFPPGKERPKRIAADFKPPSSGEEDEGALEGADDLLGLGGDLGLPVEETPEEPAEESSEDAEAPEEAEAPVEAPKKRGRPPKDKSAPAAAVAAKAEAPPPAAKKRGRPPKDKSAKAAPAPAAAPKKRGRPAKAPAAKAAAKSGKGKKK